MADNGRVARRRVVAAKVTRQEFVEPDEDDEDLELEVEEDEEEEVEEAPRRTRPVGRPRKVVEPEPDEEDEEPEPVKKPAPKAKQPVAKAAPKAKVVEPEPEDEDEESEPVARQRVGKRGMEEQQMPVQDFWRRIMESLQAGEGMVATRQEDGSYLLVSLATFNQPVAAIDGRRGRPAKAKRALSAKYVEWSKGWKTKTLEQKVAYARKKKITWDEHDNDLVNNLRVTMAVQKAEGIVKHQDEEEAEE